MTVTARSISLAALQREVESARRAAAMAARRANDDWQDGNPNFVRADRLAAEAREAYESLRDALDEELLSTDL